MSSKSRKLSHNNNNSSSSSSNTTSMIGSGGGGGVGGVLSAGLSTPTGGVPTPQRGGSLSLSVGQTVSRPFSRSSFMLRYKGDKSGKNHNVIDAIREIWFDYKKSERPKIRDLRRSIIFQLILKTEATLFHLGLLNQLAYLGFSNKNLSISNSRLGILGHLTSYFIKEEDWACDNSHDQFSTFRIYFHFMLLIYLLH
ncbi:hypothetical protein CAEBREN_07552 [Caenorhabditis brenneri]|uniref:Uncharacterized protein n=1 Tax=Caenorhabditis brenneri TaxID=135651 RepID=G0P562_CAEBE|nr:hypothetical protein CAEBREN_07552 [Caenorhabditis brenneri]